MLEGCSRLKMRFALAADAKSAKNAKSRLTMLKVLEGTLGHFWPSPFAISASSSPERILPGKASHGLDSDLTLV